MGNFPYVEIEGTPFEIGFQHGELFKDKILNSIQCYKEMFMDYSNLEWSRAKKLSTRFVEVIRDYNPDYLEEIRGVAEGSGLDFEDILALNCRSELVLWEMNSTRPTAAVPPSESAAMPERAVMRSWPTTGIGRPARESP